MTKDEFLKLDPEKVEIIDIREDDEVESIPLLRNTTHIPLSTVIERVKNGSLMKDKPIVTVCRSGRRCQILNEFLVDNGYNAQYLEGG